MKEKTIRGQILKVYRQDFLKEKTEKMLKYFRTRGPDSMILKIH